MKARVDELDIAIIKALVRDARASFRDVSKRVKVAVGTVQARVKKLEDMGVLKGFTPDIDYNRLGYDTDAVFAVRTRRNKHKELVEKLMTHKNVVSIYETTADVDLFCRVQFKSTNELYDFLHNFFTEDYVKEVKTYTVLNKVTKRDLLK
jgi:Lrp/AsnC family transcriptional regulator for asnA, asnC and gidA